MITSYRLLLECVLETQSRTTKEVFNLFALFMHYKGVFLVKNPQSPRKGIKMAEGNGVVCESIKYVCLKCYAFACNRHLKCSVPASGNYPGWKEHAKVVLCFKCDKA